MSRSRAVALIGLLLVAVASLAVGAPAAAHTASPITVPDLPAPDVPAVPSLTPAGPGTLASAGAATWLIASALGMGVLAARRRPRRAVVLTLVFLLALFAFEHALHSVHHGFDAKLSDECTIAVASAQLSAVSVDSVVEAPVILAVAGATAEPDRSPAPTRLLGPDQGRAPPVSAA